MRLLIAEDDPALAEFMAFELRRAGHDIEVAAEGYAALRLAEDHPFDLLVLDIVMPGIDGDIVARKARELRPEQPVLFVTGSYGASRVGTEATLFKPFGPDDLLQAVADAAKMEE
ncbi:MAG TPA: response regulator [Gaiellaceae bacterium]|nr:response regulator [Gaiellaceae bacterium]